jgi:dihydroorotase
MTTNSDHGVDPDDPKLMKIFADMEDIGIPLSVHGEAKGYVMDRESLFVRNYLRWAEYFPNLKIIMEHITTKDAVMALSKAENLFCTITTHHLLITTDDVIGDLLNPHLFCKPIAKRPTDLEALVGLVMGDLNGIARKAMLGTDSAPHAIDKKAEMFYTRGKLEYFQRFVSDNAKAIYGINPPKKIVTLKREPFTIPATYGNNVVPMWAGKTIPWTVESVKLKRCGLVKRFLGLSKVSNSKKENEREQCADKAVYTNQKRPQEERTKAS